MLIDRLPGKGKQFAFDYARIGKNFGAAARFLETADFAALELGRHEIDGENVFVNIQEYVQQEKEPAYETHDRYADIQLVLRGSERFRWGTGKPGQLTGDFREVTGVEDHVEFTLRENQFVVFLPGEAHAPGLPENGPACCRKAVVKVLCEAE